MILVLQVLTLISAARKICFAAWRGFQGLVYIVSYATESDLLIAGEENIQDHAYKYLTTEEMKGLGDDSMQIDVTNDEKDKKDTLNRSDIISQGSCMDPLSKLSNS